MTAEIAAKIADLRARGQATDITGLNALLQQKTTLATEIAGIEQRAEERNQCCEERVKLREELAAVRTRMTERRKLATPRESMATSAGRSTTTLSSFSTKVLESQPSSRDSCRRKCTALTSRTISSRRYAAASAPPNSRILVLSRNHGKLASTAKVSTDWAQKIIDKLCYWNIIFDLQALAKPPKPIITVRTKTTPAKEIPVLQLSDGQRHTILLTIAMLADTNVPLVIDQPEDDLDNAFIFSSIVATLRAIKEKRQVILVTHNANIAVLGDSELLMPMCRENDCGKVVNRGSIDTTLTKRKALNILEGGPAAFLRRKEIYGY